VPVGKNRAVAVTIPKPSDAVLFNPRMGRYMQYPPLDSPNDHWMMRIADIAYYRVDWAEINPKEDGYGFDEFFKPRFEKWVGQEHKRVAFRAMSSNMHSRREYVTQEWVFDKGLPGVEHQSVYGKKQTDPVFWDDHCLDLQCRVVAGSPFVRLLPGATAPLEGPAGTNPTVLFRTPRDGGT